MTYVGIGVTDKGLDIMTSSYFGGGSLFCLAMFKNSGLGLLHLC